MNEEQGNSRRSRTLTTSRNHDPRRKLTGDFKDGCYDDPQDVSCTLKFRDVLSSDNEGRQSRAMHCGFSPCSSSLSPVGKAGKRPWCVDNPAVQAAAQALPGSRGQKAGPARGVTQGHVPCWKQSYDEVDAYSFISTIDGFSIFKTHPNHLKERLIAYPEKFAMFEEVQDDKEEQATFYLHKYGDSNIAKGLAVAISCNIGDRDYFLEANSNSVDIVKRELPPEILTDTSGLIFYLIESSVGQNSFRLESSLREGFCLAWNAEKKLILKQWIKDYIDETAIFFLVNVATLNESHTTDDS